MTDLPDAYRGKAYAFPADQLVVAAADYDTLHQQAKALAERVRELELNEPDIVFHDAMHELGALDGETFHELAYRKRSEIAGLEGERNTWKELATNAESRAAQLEAELAARNDELGRYMMANNRLAQELEAVRKALMELVELKDLHDKIEASEFTVTKARQQQEYEKRKPLAWKAARAAIDREKA